MISYLKNEFSELIKVTKTLDFKTVYIFISVAIIIFLSLTVASPSFYYDHFGKNRLESRIYWFLMDGSFMFLIPVLSIKFVFKFSIKLLLSSATIGAGLLFISETLDDPVTTTAFISSMALSLNSIPLTGRRWPGLDLMTD